MAILFLKEILEDERILLETILERIRDIRKDNERGKIFIDVQKERIYCETSPKIVDVIDCSK
jgi:hypothetical protein